MFDLGRESEVKALGRVWRVGRLTLGVLEDFTQWVRQQVGDPFDGIEKLVDKVPRDMALQLIKDAQAKRDALASMDLDSPAVQQFQKTTRGMLYLLWLMLRQNHPDIDRDQVFDIARDVGLTQVHGAVTAGAGHLGNGAAPETPVRGELTGPKSTAV